MTDFTLSPLAVTVAEGDVYSFTITPNAALSGATTARWEIVGTGELPFSRGDLYPLKGTVNFASGATVAKTISITPTDDTAREVSKDFEIRIYQVVGADDSGASTETNDILLGSQVVTLTDADTGVFGTRSLGSNAEGNIITAATTQDLALNAGGGDDTYIVTRFQHGDVLITDTQDSNLVKFDYGVSITDFAEISVNSAGVITISSVTLTLSTGAEIEIAAPAGEFSYQLGAGAVLDTYADFKMAIGASGTNAASALAATKTIDTFTSVPDVSENVLPIRTDYIYVSRGDDILGSGSDASYVYFGDWVYDTYSYGDDTYIITRFQSGNVKIIDSPTDNALGDNIVKFDYGVSITDFAETSSNNGRIISRVTLTLSTGAEIAIEAPVSNFDFQLGDDAVISYAAFKTAIGASGTKIGAGADTSALAAPYAVALPSSDPVTTPVIPPLITASNFTLSTLAVTVAEGGTYSFTLTPSGTPLTGTTVVRWEIVANGELPIFPDDFAPLKGTVSFASGATVAQTISITPTDDTELEITKDFEIRIYQVVGADDSGSSTETNDILLGSQAVTLTDADAEGNAEGNILTAASTQDLVLDAGGGDDTYIITRFQHGDVLITDTQGANLVKFDYGVSITDFAEISVNSAGVITISSVTLTLSTGAEIEIAAPASGFSYQLGASAVLDTYTDFKTAIGASGTNAASALAATKTIDTFTSVPDVSENVLAVPDVFLEDSDNSEVFGFGSDFNFTASDRSGDSTYIVTRFQSGDVDIYDSPGSNLIKFDFGVSIEGFAEVSTIHAWGQLVESLTLTLSTGAEIVIDSFHSTFQLGDDTVINYAAFKTAIGASGTNGSSALVSPYTINSPTTGTVSITHAETSAPDATPNTGEVLTAVTTNLTDVDDDALTFTYQWKLAGADITGATSKTYAPTAVGAYTVVVTATDSVNNVDTAFTSAAFDEVNHEPTGAVTVTTLLSVNVHGLVFTAKVGGDANAETKIAFGNLVNFSFGVAEEGNTFFINYKATDDAENTLGEIFALLQGQARVTDNFVVTTGAGYDATASSVVLDTLNNGEGTFDEYSFFKLARPEVGTPTLGEVLTVDTSTIADADGLGAFSYQWLRGGEDISGAESITYTQVAADAGKALTVRVSYTDARGTAETVTSINADTATTGTVTITHAESSAPDAEPNVGEILTAVTSGLSDADDSVLTFTYQWKLAGADIAGATSKTYAPTALGVYTVTVTATDSVQSVDTAFTSAVFDEINDVPTGAVTVITPLSVNVEGIVFTAKAGGVVNAETVIVFGNSTYFDFSTYFSAPHNTFFISYNTRTTAHDMLGEIFADLQNTLVTDNFVVTTGAGYDATASSGVLDMLHNGVGAFSGRSLFNLVQDPKVGTPTLGEVLTADTSALTDADGLGSDGFTYQWLRGGEDISGATAATYTTVAADVDKALTVRVSYTDARGTNETVTSINADTPTTGAVTITYVENSKPTNAANVGEVLTAVTSGLSDADDAELTFTYQWQLDGVNVATGGSSDGTGATYTPTAIGSYTVTVTAFDDVNNVNTDFTSSAKNVLPVSILVDTNNYTASIGTAEDNNFISTTGASRLYQGAGGDDLLGSGTGSNVLIGGTGNDTINLKDGAGTDIIIHRFASGGTDWINSDGADTITNFQRGIDKFVFTDIDGTAITNVTDFLAGLETSDFEARVESFDPAGQIDFFNDKIHKLEIRFGTSGDYLEINFSGDTSGANLITSDSVSSGLADTTNALIHTVTDFAIFDDLFGTGSFDVYATADLGVTIL